MSRRFAALALSTALILTSLALPAPTAAQTVRSMAATGDSITRAFNLCFFPFTDCPAQSWSTGTNTTVDSHARRLKITSSAFNDAVSGAKMADLPGQMSTVVGRNVDYVTVLMGGNDVCTDTEGGMTPTSDYLTAFRQAMDRLKTDSTPPLVYVVSVPNVQMLWEILKDNSTARSRWSSYNVCQSLLANPLSMERADVDRRERVKQRNMELNQALRAACSSAAYNSFCRFDGERAFGTAFVPNDVSTRDYFHPSTAGQKKLAEVSWNHGPLINAAVNHAPTANFTSSCSGLTCTFTDTSSDSDGVVGWSWNFDATRTAGPTDDVRHPTHTFAAGGTYTVKLYAIDRYGATASTSQEVTVTVGGGGTEPTTGAIDGVVTDTSGTGIPGASVSVLGPTNATTTTGEDGSYRIATLDPGDYTVDASKEGYDATAAKAVTVAANTTVTADFTLTPTESEPAPPPEEPPLSTTISVGGLSATSTSGGRTWTASVTILVVDGNGSPVQHVAVSGTWSAGTGSGDCTTGPNGTCVVTTGPLSKSTSSVTYTVTGLALSGYTYEPENTQTSILVTKP